MLWLWHDTGDARRIGNLALSSTLYVNESLPAFILIVVSLRRGFAFPLAMAEFVLIAGADYLVLIWAGER